MNALKLMGRGDDLSADEEQRFRAWLKQNPDSTKTDAELRQLWRSQQGATPPVAANALQGPMPIAWGDPASQPVPQQNGMDGLTPEFLAEIKRQMGHGGGGLAETEIPIPRWAERLGINRPVTPDADPGMVVQPRRTDVDSLYGNTGFVAPGDLRPLPRNAQQGPMPIALPPEIEQQEGPPGYDERMFAIPTFEQRIAENRPANYAADPGMVVQPQRSDTDSIYERPALYRPSPWKMPSYQQGTDYVPEDGPAKLHEGEMVIPKREADRIRADMPSVTIKPRLSQEDIEKLWRDRGYPPAGAKGAARNAMRESGGSSSVMGDQGTSGGLFQHHNTRLTELKAWAAEHGKPWTDPATQVDFADHELQTKFPELRKRMMSATDDNVVEDQFKRIFERPASVMWSNDSGGRPVLGNDRYRFSDYAMGEHSGRRGTSLLYMDPQDYLDLSPPFDDDPKTSRSGRSLRASVGRGDAVESVPSLDMRVQGQTGTVTAQDGRNRALLAQEEGIDAIPVAVRQKGQGEPTEIAGMSGTILPNDFRKAEHVSRETSPDRSILGRAMDMIIPRAEAAEAKPGAQANPFDQFDDPASAASASPVKAVPNPFDQFDAPAGGDKPAGDHRSVAERVGTGMVDPFVGLAQLTGNVVGGGMSMLPGALGRAGTSLQDFTNRKTAEREAGIQGERGGETGIDWWRLGGNVASPINLIPMGALGRAGGMLGRGLGGAAARGAVAGGVGALTQPVTEGDFTTGKAEQVAGGVLAGGALGTVGGALPRMLGGPASGTPARSLMDQGVRLTPGQMMGGAAKRTEEKMESLPIMGDAIKAAQRRAIQDFNRAAYNRVLEPIGEKYQGETVGYDGIKGLGERLSQAYDRVLGGVRLHADQAFVDDMSNLRDLVSEMPGDQARQFNAVMQNRVLRRLAPSGTMDGQTFKQVESELTTKSFALHGSRDAADRQLGDAFDSVNAALRDNLERTNPGKQAELKAANKAWAMFARVRKAAGNRVSSEGIFTPGDLLAASKQGDRTAGKGLFARGDALLQDLGADGMKVLGNRYPDSGTAGRGLLGLGIGGTAAGSFFPAQTIGMVGALGAGGAAYTSPAINLLNRFAGPNARNMLNAAQRRLGPLEAPAGIAAGIAGSNALTDMQSITVRPEGAPQ